MSKQGYENPRSSSPVGSGVVLNEIDVSPVLTGNLVLEIHVVLRTLFCSVILLLFTFHRL